MACQMLAWPDGPWSILRSDCLCFVPPHGHRVEKQFQDMFAVTSVQDCFDYTHIRSSVSKPLPDHQFSGDYVYLACAIGRFGLDGDVADGDLNKWDVTVSLDRRAAEVRHGELNLEGEERCEPRPGVLLTSWWELDRKCQRTETFAGIFIHAQESQLGTMNHPMHARRRRCPRQWSNHARRPRNR